MSGAQKEIAGADSNQEYQPVVKLTAKTVDSGENDETEIYKHRCALYRFAPSTKEWKERGRGDVRLMQHNTTKRVRVILRESKTLKLRMNHYVQPDVELTANSGSDRSMTWAAQDYSEDEPAVHTFAIKFKNSEIADAYKAKINECREINKKCADKSIDVKSDTAKSSDDTKNAGLFASVLSPNMDPFPEEDLKKLWNAYDKDGSNTIDATELSDLFKDLVKAVCTFYKLGPDCSELNDILAKIPAYAATVLSQLDGNKDGKLQFDEFMKIGKVELNL